jgi:acyl carrier protein
VDTRHDRIAEALERFIRLEGSVATDDAEFGRDIDVLETGYLDSLGIVHLIAHIEQEFDLQLTDDVLLDPRFASINGIAAILAEELQQTPAHS